MQQFMLSSEDIQIFISYNNYSSKTRAPISSTLHKKIFPNDDKALQSSSKSIEQNSRSDSVDSVSTAENKGVNKATKAQQASDDNAASVVDQASPDNKAIDKTHLIVNGLKELKEEIASKPVQQVTVDSFGNLAEAVYRNGVKDTIKYKGKSRI